MTTESFGAADWVLPFGILVQKKNRKAKPSG